MILSRILHVIIGLAGLSVVIIVHELGHLIAAKLVDVPAPLFSIGFGPALIGITIGTTIYQLALLPIGGYVAIPQDILDVQPYWIKAFILLAGVGANFLFAFLLFFIFRLRRINVQEMIAEAFVKFQNKLLGPIGIIALISHSAFLGFDYLLLVLGALSFSIGFFNLLPIPFFDGGQLAWYTLEAIVGPLPESAFNITTYIFIGLFILFLLYISFKDIRMFRR